MDTEKYLEIQKKLDQGLSPNDEGPYYHHAWWEAYKGSVKGKFGGLIIGALVGSVVGGIIAGVAAIATAGTAAAVGLPLAAAITAGFASVGALFGTHEFGDIGKVTGAVAAAQEESEVRMKLYEEGRFNELKNDIAEIKAIIKGDNNAAQVAAKQSQQSSAMARELEEKPYRTTHYAQLEPDRKNRFAFWKVSLIGLVVGVAAGALFAYTGAAEHLLGNVVGEHGLLHGLSLTTASMGAFGALGASFGLNRDLFRQIFDKTDLWFKGVTSRTATKAVEQQQVAAGLAIEEELSNGKNGNGKHVTAQPTPSYESMIDYPESNTYHRDRVAAAAEKALLSFDHTRATPH
ncbi:MAG: hypothetical protein ACK502_01630 [Alphaproteobacteria bacterium]